MKRAMKPNLNILRYLLAFFPLAALALCVGILAFFFYKQTPEIFSSSERTFFKAEYEALTIHTNKYSQLFSDKYKAEPLPRENISAQASKTRKALIHSLLQSYKEFTYRIIDEHRSFSFWVFQEFNAEGPYPALLKGYADYLRETSLPMAEKLKSDVPVLLDYYGDTLRPYISEHQHCLDQYIVRVRETLDQLDKMLSRPDKSTNSRRPDHIDLQKLFSASCYPDDLFDYLALNPKDFSYVDAATLSGTPLKAMNTEYLSSFKESVQKNSEAMQRTIQRHLADEGDPIVRERLILLGQLFNILSKRIQWVLEDNLTAFNIMQAYQRNGPQSAHSFYLPVLRVFLLLVGENAMPLQFPFVEIDGGAAFGLDVTLIIQNVGRQMLEYLCMQGFIYDRSYPLRMQKAFEQSP